MRYLRQFVTILSASFTGEIIHRLLDIPVPGSVFGLLLLFICLQKNIIRIEDIKETASFLLEIMPIFFIPAAVGLMQVWDALLPVWLPFVIITVLGTFTVIVAAGKITQFIIHYQGRTECVK